MHSASFRITFLRLRKFLQIKERRVGGGGGGGLGGALGYGVFGAGSGFWRGFHFGAGAGHCAVIFGV